MPEDILIRCEGVSRKFCRDLKQSLWYGVQDIAMDILRPAVRNGGSGGQNALRDGEFWANKDISFEVQRGECFGLVGRNGAGKTTLLKMLNGLIKPDRGQIELRGRIGALIALGAGFNPILTGRENVVVNGSILGLTRRQIRQRFDEIVGFAELEEFIDTPVQNYSSGMKVRLGFAIATTIRPEILLIDEVLAVGDVEFRIRCGRRIKDVLGAGCAVVLVSHDMTQICNLCDSVIWLERGKVHQTGEPQCVIRNYLVPGSDRQSPSEWRFSEESEGSNRSVQLKRITVTPPNELDEISISTGARILVEFDSNTKGLRLDYTLDLRNDEGIPVFHSGGILDESGGSQTGRYEITTVLPPHLLNSGTYSLSVWIGEGQSTILSRVDHAVTFKVQNEAAGANFSQLPGVIAPKLDWSFSVSNPDGTVVE